MPTPPVIVTTIYDQYGLPLPSFADTKETNPSVAGTATPSGNLLANATNPIDGSPVTDIYHYPINELPDSPTIEVAEQCTTTKTFSGPYAYFVTLLPVMPRGALFQDQESNVTRILTARIQRQRGLMGLLTIITESVSFDTPPDEFSITPVELSINIMKHPRYFYALNPDPVNDTVTERQVKQSIIRAIQTYQESPMFPSADYVNGLFQSQFITDMVAKIVTYTVPNPINGFPLVIPYIDSVAPSAKVQLAMAAAQEIIQKLWRLEDSPYLVGWQISWSVYYYRPPYLTPGGYIQDPISDTNVYDNPGLPDYFYSTQSPPVPDTGASGTGTDIFSQMAHLNPQCFSSDGTPSGNVTISCLRKADDYDYQRTWFKVTRTWIGSAYGAWDAQIFGKGVPANGYSPNRPTVPTDYLLLV